MKPIEEKRTAPDGTSLFIRRYQSKAAGEQRTVLFVHGTGEHAGRYDHVFRKLADSGWNILAADLRGHGQSDGPHTHIDNFVHYTDDLSFLYECYALDPQRTVVMGHSLGGLIAIRFAELHPDKLAALVVLSPLLALKVHIDLFTFCLGRIMSVVAPRVRFQSRVDPNWTTRNLEVLERRAADPMIRRSITAGWFFQMKATLRKARTEASKITVPVLALQAALDRLVDPLVVEPWLESTSSSRKSFRWLSEHYHELLNEPDWQDTLAYVCEWIDDVIPAEAQRRADAPVGRFSQSGE